MCLIVIDVLSRDLILYKADRFGTRILIAYYNLVNGA